MRSILLIAITNGVFVACVNRVGIEEDLNFWGSSFICDPFGGLLTQSPGRREEILLAQLDGELIEKTRITWPFFRDRRPTTYQEILKKSHP